MRALLACLGMPVADPEELTHLLLEARKISQRVGAYAVWTCPSGAQLWILSQDELLIGFSPHFAGRSRLSARLLGNAEEEGLIMAVGAPETDHEFPLCFLSPEFRNLSLEGGTRRNLQVCAYATDTVQLAASLEEREASGSFHARWGAEICMAIGILDPSGAPVEPPEPTVIYSGTVQGCELLRNSLTGGAYVRVQLGTAGGEVDLLMPERARLPVAGEILTAPAYVTGRVVP